MADGNDTYQEITSQADAWQATLAHFGRQADNLMALIKKPYRQVLFTGCGSTYYLSLAAAAAWQLLTGQAARAVPASELWLYPDAVLSSGKTLLVTVSRSGETTETLRALSVFQQRNGDGDNLAITVYDQMEMARRATFCLATKGAEEKSVAQTRSFSSMYLLALASAYLAAGDQDGLAALGQVPSFFEGLLRTYESLSRGLADNSNLERFVFLGSGPNYGLASEAMLKMKEMSLSSSEVFHFLEFRHGPKSVAGPGTLVAGLLGDTAYEEEIKVLSEMRELGATTLAFADRRKNVPADYVVDLNTGLGEMPRSILMLPVLQLLAYYRARAKQLNPDLPANLDAVVRL